MRKQSKLIDVEQVEAPASRQVTMLLGRYSCTKVLQVWKWVKIKFLAHFSS